MTTFFILFSFAAALIVRMYATRAMRGDPAIHSLIATTRHKAWF